MSTQIISGHNLGLLDGSLANLLRNDRANAGSLADGVTAFVNVGNGNLIYQQRDGFLPSLGADFDLLRTYNSRGVIPGTFDGWSYSTGVTLQTHNDVAVDGKTVRSFTVSYGDQSVMHFDPDGARWVSTDGAGAFEVLTEVQGGNNGPAYLVVRADQSQYRFDKQGLLLSVTDPNGVAMSFTYQGGKLRTVQDDSGHTITFVQQGTQLQSITKTSATDRSVVTLATFGYTQSQLTSVTDRMGHVTRYTYDNNGMLIGVQLPYQQTVNGQPQTDEQRNLSFTYERFYWDDKPHLITPFDQGYSYILRTMTDSMGGLTSFDYDFRFAQTMAPEDRDQAYTDGGAREFQGGTSRVVDALGNARATSNAAEYVAWRQANGHYATYSATVPLALVEAIRNAHALVYTVDANSQVTQVVDQLGFKTTYAWDAKGNLASMIDRNGFAAVARDDQTPGDGYYRKLRVDLGFADQPISWYSVQPDWATLQAQILARFTTSYTYDAAGNQTSMTDGAGYRSTRTFTSFNKVATSTTAMGHALAELDTPEIQAKRIELGHAGLLANLSPASQTALRQLYTTSYAYDARQNLVQRTDPGGDVTRFTYAANGNLLTRTVVVPAINGNAAQDQVTTYTYDPYGNVATLRDGEGFTSTQVYDTFGNLLSTVDPRGGVTTFTYDADNRLLSTRTPEGRTTTSAYDAVGNRIAFTDFAGRTLTQLFDRNNLLLATIDPSLSGAAGNRTTSYQFDIVGNRTQMTDAQGRVTRYTFDARRLMVEALTPQVTGADGTLVSYTSRYAYDGETNRITEVDNNGNTTQTQYDNRSLMRRVTEANGNVTEFRHDANRLQFQVIVGAQLPVGQRRVMSYRYDEEDQQVAEVDALGGVSTTLYDAAGNAVAQTDQNNHQTRFEFDRNNRQIKEILPADDAGVVHTRLHSFDGNGNEVTTTDENGKITRTYFDRDDRRGMVTDANGIHTVYEYDTRNNVTRVILGAVASYNTTTAKVVLGDMTDAQVETYTYDEFNQLVGLTDGVGWALANSNSVAAQAMRVEAGKSANVTGLSTTDKTAFLDQFTERYAYDKVGNRLTERDHLGRITNYVYDALNREVSRTDAFGTAVSRTASFRYDGNDNQVRSVDVLGRVATYVFDAVDQIVQATDALGVVTRFSYDQLGNKLTQLQAAGTPDERSTSWQYDLNDRIVTETDAGGHATRYQYDAVGNRVRVTDAKGGVTQYVYDARDRNIRILDPLNLQTRMVYDGAGNQIQLIDPRGGIRAVAFDGGNRIVQTTDAEGRVTRFGFDVLGNAVSITTAFGRAEAQTTTFVYDAEGNLRKATGALGNVTTQGYDAVYNLTRTVDGNGRATTTQYDALNREIQVTDALGGVTRYTFDAADNRLTETDPLNRTRSFAYDAGDRVISSTDAAGVETKYAYDFVGNRTSITEAVGQSAERSTDFIYDLDNLLVRQVDALGGQTLYAYDANHNVASITDPLGHVTSYAHDADNRVVAITDPIGGVTEYGYDGNGNRTSVKNSRGFTTQYAYNANNELTSVTDPLGASDLRSYDGNGNLIAYRDGNGNTSSYAYDALNRRIRETNPGGAAENLAYDAVGNLIRRTDENGKLTTFEYDALDRLVRRTNAASGVATYAYDAVGNRTGETDERNATTTYVYDALDREIRKTNALNGIVTKSYDAVGNLLQEVDEAGRSTSYQVDALGRVLVQTNALGHVRTMSYDAVGNVLTQTDENGRVVSFQYDAKDRLVRQVNPIGTFLYGYDAEDNRTSETDPDGNVTRLAYDANDRLIDRIDPLGGHTTYTYDAGGRKITETDPNGHSAQYGYDVNDRLVRLTDGEGYIHTMAYDAAGNVLRRTQQLDKTNPARQAITTEQYDALNRVVATLTADGRLIRYTYDAAGNVTAKTEHGDKYTIPPTAVVPNPAGADTGKTTSYAHDLLGRQTSETSPEGVVTTYGYDAVGNRTSEIAGAGGPGARSKNKGYDNAHRLVRETDAMGTETRYVLDARGNVLERHAAFGTANVRVTLWAYDANSRIVREVDAQGYVTTFTYNASGDMLTRTREGRTESFEYDGNHRLTATVNAAGERTEYRYDGAGNRTQIRYGIKGGQPPLRVVSYEYDESDHLTAEVDGTGARTEHRYDGAGNRIQTIQNALGTTAEQRHTYFGYDGDNRLVSVTNPEGGVTTYAYDTQGNQSEITLPGGSVTRNTFDRNSRLTVNNVYANGPKGGIKTVNTYDVHGNVLSTTVSFGDGSDSRTTSYAYDALDRQTSVTDGEGFTTQFGYDAFGNQTSITTGLYLLTSGQAGYDAAKAARAHRSRVEFSYDKLDNLVQTKQITNNTSGAGDSIVATYDAFGNRLSQTTGAGTPGQRTQGFAYDLANRLTRQDSAAGGVLILEYDAAGNQTARRQLQSGTEGTASAVWAVTTYTYDGNGRVRFEDEVLDASTTIRTEHVYDRFGNETETIEAAGSADERRTRYEFDRNNELVRQIEAFGTPEARSTRYVVNTSGQRTQEIDALGRVTHLYYDGAGRHVGTLDPVGFYSQFTRDAAGNIIETRTYQQRFIAVPATQFDTNPPVPLAGAAVRVVKTQFDRVGNVVRQELADGTVMTYVFNGNRKLIQQNNLGSSDAARVALTSGSLPAQLELRWTYDDALRMVSFVNADGSVETYAYDSANNKTSESLSNPNGLPGGRSDPVRTTVFAYDSDNRLIEQRFDPTGLNLVERLAYDKAGNVVTKTDARGGVTASTYDRLNRLLSVTDALGGESRFTYDRVGNQLTVRNARGHTTELAYDRLNQLVRQTLPAVDVFTIDSGLQTNQRPTTVNVYDAVGNVVQEINENGGTTTRWFDANDNAIAELDAEGVLRTSTYDASGNVLSSTLYMIRLVAAAHNPALMPSPPAGASRTTSLEYDAGNRTIRTILPTITVATLANTASGDAPTDASSSLAPTKVDSYDRFGNLVKSEDVGGRTVYGWYDRLGRQVASVDAEGYLTETDYDNQGNIAQQRRYATRPTAIDPAVRPTPPSGAVAVTDRIYDAARRLVEEISPAAAVHGSASTERIRTTFIYDLAGNLTQRTLAAGTTEAQTEYTWYDANNRVVAVVNGARTLHRMQYDANGNQTQLQRFYNPVSAAVNLATATLAQVIAGAPANAANDQTTVYAFDALNRMKSQTQTVNGSGYSSMTYRVDHDGAGNETRKTDGENRATRVAYDARGFAVRTITADNVTSIVEFNAAGEKVRNWTGVLGSSGAQVATAVSARIDGDLVFSWSQGGASNLTSYVVYDTESHGDSQLTSITPDQVYDYRSGSAGTGNVSRGVPLSQFNAGQTVYFRVLSVDPGGSQAWTEERTLVVPARATAVDSAQSGSNLVVTVRFNGTVTSPQLRFGSTSALGSSVAMSGGGGNVWTATVAQAQAGFFALTWTYNGATLQSSAAPFGATGPHTYDSTTGEASWTLPDSLAALQGAPGQVIVLDGVRLHEPTYPQYTFAGAIHFQPKLPAGNATRTLNVLYGNEVAWTHDTTIAVRDEQFYSLSFSSTATSVTRTYNYQHSYVTRLAVSMHGDEALTMNADGLRVAYRAADTSAAFGASTGFSRSGNTFSGAIALSPNGASAQNYDLKIYYVDTSGREVIVEWRRITVSPTALPTNFSQTDSTSPYVFDGFTLFGQPGAVVTSSQAFNDGTSVQVLAREFGGSITRNGANITIASGAYSGPMSARAASFGLDLGTTALSLGGQRLRDGLAAQTYFTEIEYNALGQVIGSNEDDGLWRRYGVDAFGNKLVTRLYGTRAAETAHAGGDTSMAPIVTYSVFDKRDMEIARFGARVTVSDGSQHRQVTRSTYDYDRRMVTKLEPNPGALTMTYTYDAVGHLLAQTDSAGKTTRYTYDRLGHTRSVTDPLSHVKLRSYDSGGRMTQESDGAGAVTSFVVDAFDRIVRRTDPLGNVTQYTYDQRDRLTAVSRVADTAFTWTASFGYDRANNRVRDVDASGRVTTTAYDVMNRVASVSTTSKVVSDGVLQTLTDSYSYDAYGNRVTETDEEGRVRSISYGASGRVTAITDEGGRVTNLQYDRFGRQTREWGGMKDVRRTYNDAHWLLTVEDFGNGTDANGLVPDAASVPAWAPRTKTVYTYDIGGERKTEVVTDRETPTSTASVLQPLRSMTYTHDGMGRLTRWSDSVTGLHLNYQWDDAGNQRRVWSDDNTTNHVYTYDNADRVTEITEDGAVTSSRYGYDSAGRRTAQTVAGTAYTYSYDGIGRVKSARDTTGTTRATWSYDAMGNVLDYQEFKADGTTLLRRTTNTYFENGLTKSSRSHVPEKISDDEDKQDQTTTSEYDKSGRLVKQTLVNSTDPDEIKTYTYTFEYTADGRTKKVSVSGSSDATGNSLSTYDANDRLIVLDKGKGGEQEANEILTFRYDSDGHIAIRKHDDGEEDTATAPLTRFLYAEGNPVGETGTNTSGGTVTLLDENGLSGDKQDMQYRLQQNISKDLPEATGSSYTVRAGDSLQAIAGAVYGNSSLWFLIADANGLDGDSSLSAGQVLRVPSSIESGRLTADAQVLYKESDIIGSKLPNIATSSGSNTCAIIGAIIGLIFFAIIAVIISIVSLGTLAPAVWGAFGFAAGSVGAVLVTIAVGAVVGAVAAAAISAISQGILIAAGLQKSFDWTQFGADVVMGFIGGIAAGIGQVVQVAKAASLIVKVVNVVAQVALESVGETARQAIANNGRIDNPWTIIAAGAGAGLGQLAGRGVRLAKQLSKRLPGLLGRRIVTVGADGSAKAVRLLGKSQRVAVQGLKKGVLDDAAEGASIFKRADVKFVKVVGDDGVARLQMVERTAVKAGKPVTLHKFKDTGIKLVRVGDEVRVVRPQTLQQRISNFAFKRVAATMQKSGVNFKAANALGAKTAGSLGAKAPNALGAAASAKALAALPGPATIKAATAAVAPASDTFKITATLSKSRFTKLVRGVRETAAGAVQETRVVPRNRTIYWAKQKGYTTIAKASKTNALAKGTKLVKVGDEVQVWQRVSSQYTVGQRLLRKFAKTSLADIPVLGKKIFGKYRPGTSLPEKGAVTKLTLQGMKREFNGKAWVEVPDYVATRRLSADKLNILANKSLYVKMKLADLGTAIKDAIPLGKGRGLEFAATLAEASVKGATTGALISLRDYDNYSYFIPYTTTIAKTVLLAATKGPREQLNQWLLNQSLEGIGKDNEVVNLAIHTIRKTMYGFEQKWHQWLPFDWVATGANVLSRAQSPIDLDYNQTAEQRLRTTRMGSGQTAGFDPWSVFRYAADLDGRINNPQSPLLLMSALPPAPQASPGGA